MAAMKVYRITKTGVIQEAEAPDGGECIDLGVRPLYGDGPPVIAIDYTNNTMKRQGFKYRPFPPIWYRGSDLTWTDITLGHPYR